MAAPTVSLCMIIKNEAEALPRCLASLESGDSQHLIQEKIILDTGSSDNSVDIAQSLGCQVFHYRWQNDFAAARNQSLCYATSDWVLVLDADEQLVPGALDALSKLLQQPQILAINLLRQEVGATQSPYSSVSRLFRRHPALQFCRPYHAMIDDSVTALQAQESDWKVVDTSQISICHGGYQPGEIANQNKFHRARQAMEGHLASHPNDPYCCAKLGALYGEQGDWPKGLSLLEQGLSATNVDSSTSYELHYHLAIGHRHQGNPEAAADHYQAALEVEIPDLLKLGAYNNFASLLQSEGLGAMAQELYEQAIAIDPNFATAHYNLGKLKREQGDLPGAIAAYETARSLTPHVPEIHQNLAVALLKAGAVAQSQAAFQQAIALYDAQANPNGSSQANALRRQLTDLGLL